MIFLQDGQYWQESILIAVIDQPVFRPELGFRQPVTVCFSALPERLRVNVAHEK
jgi:hypothetical protein